MRFFAFGDDWVFEPKKIKLKKVPIRPDVILSPDGQKIAFVKDYNLWVRHLSTGREYALTSDGEAEKQYASIITNDSIQAIWSPDSKFIFTHQFDVKK